MISISSLNKIHKKGVFGDHQNKDQNSLTIISEVKDLKIIQIVHYRKSTLNISSIKLRPSILISFIKEEEFLNWTI